MEMEDDYETDRLERVRSEWVTCVDLVSQNVQMAGDLNNMPDYGGKIAFLEERCRSTDQKNMELHRENANLTDLLETETTRAAICLKQLKFIKDNHANFETLKQTYLKVKYLESSGRETIDIKEQACQTCHYQYENFVQNQLDVLPVKKTDFDAAQAMIDGIKKIVEQRETSWALNRIREQSLRCSVDNLERENTLLRAYIQAKDLEIEALETDANILEQHVIHNCLLRKLLIKFEKKVRESEKNIRPAKYPILNEQENEFLSLLLEPSIVTRNKSCLSIHSSHDKRKCSEIRIKPPLNLLTSSDSKQITELFSSKKRNRHRKRIAVDLCTNKTR